MAKTWTDVLQHFRKPREELEWADTTSRVLVGQRTKHILREHVIKCAACMLYCVAHHNGATWFESLRRQMGCGCNEHVKEINRMGLRVRKICTQ